MTPYMVHIHPDEGGALPRDMWHDVACAANMQAALVFVLGMYPGHRPVAGWVADTTGPKHPNGAPMVVFKFALEWGAPCTAKTP